MTKCEFCPVFFTPRPQTKKARACDGRDCQHKRQRLNEKEWRIRNKGDYGAEYYAEYRKSRWRLILEMVERVLRALQIGGTAVQEHFSIDEFREILPRFFLRLGIRCASKLCSS